ncbi:MAG: TolC family protein [Saprospiraceae bacterium]|nr:TolC family protein [Saprospiraceae bacterium]
MFRTILLAALCGLCFLGGKPEATGQTLRLQQVLDSALQFHPVRRAAALKAQQQRELLPTATALPDPVLNLESPTGNFYTLGLTQSFDFPAVYRRQKALQQTQLERANTEIAVVEQELKYRVALAFTDWQYQYAVLSRLAAQDSAAQATAAAAERLFQQGQGDALQAQFARLQAATGSVRLRQAERGVLLAWENLRALSGLQRQGLPEPFDVRLLAPLESSGAGMAGTPAGRVGELGVAVAERELVLTQSRQLPRLTLGYLNQGDRNSPWHNRFNVGLNVPLWRKQYSAGTQAAKTGVDIARQHLATQSLEWQVALGRAQAEAAQQRQALVEYADLVLPAARSLSDTARRLYEGGLSDLSAYLRYRNDALEAELSHCGLQRDAQVSALTLLLLNGRL